MEAGGDGGSGSGRSNNVNLPTAYLLYCFGGLFGLHHAYLHRPRQALGWYASAGLFGWGLLRDLFRMPSYVSLANGRPNDVHVKVRAAKVGARDGVPPMSPARIALMWAFGAWFGFLASCMVCLPQEEDPPGSGARGGLWWTSLGWTDVAYGVLGALGTAGGVWLVGNMGEEAILASPGGGGLGEFARLAAWCLASYALTNHPVLGGIVCAVRHRRYRPSMCPTATKATGPPPPSTARRAGRHLLVCAAYTALLAVAAYNHGHVTVDGGRRIYLHEAVRNALNSEFWKEFDWAEFSESSGRGGQEGGDYLKNMFDVQGERGARRLLGVARDAPHAEVRKSYKRLALRYHPDKIGADAADREREEAQRQFVKVQEAYDILNDIERARKKEGTAEAGGGDGSERGRHREQRPRRDEM